MAKQYDTTDPLVALMHRFGIQATRESYLELAYMGEVPDPLGAEQEADLPVELAARGRG